jgi:hypothetical protein
LYTGTMTVGYTHQLKITEEVAYEDTEGELEKCTNFLDQKGSYKNTERRNQ